MPNDGTYRYKHQDKADMIAFTTGIMYGQITKYGTRDNNDAMTLFITGTLTGTDVPARSVAANGIIFGLLISMIDDATLRGTLSTTYLGQGLAALEYIKNSFDHGDNDDRLADATDGYYISVYRKKI